MTDPRRPSSQRAETVVQRPAHRAATLAHDEALASRERHPLASLTTAPSVDAPPPSPPRPRAGRHPLADVPTLPGGEAPQVDPPPPAAGSTAPTSPSLDALPGIAEAESWAKSVRAAAPGDREEMLIRATERNMVAIARNGAADAGRDAKLEAMRGLLDKSVSQLGELSQTFSGMRTVLGASVAYSLEALAVSEGAVAIAEDARPGSSVRGVPPSSTRVAQDPTPDLTTTMGVGPGGRPASQRGADLRALAEVPASAPAAPAPPRPAPAPPAKPTLTRGQRAAVLAFEAGCALLLWGVYEITKSFTLKYLPTLFGAP